MLTGIPSRSIAPTSLLTTGASIGTSLGSCAILNVTLASNSGRSDFTRAQASVISRVAFWTDSPGIVRLSIARSQRSG
jgi:hypothetical protein